MSPRESDWSSSSSSDESDSWGEKRAVSREKSTKFQSRGRDNSSTDEDSNGDNTSGNNKSDDGDGDDDASDDTQDDAIEKAGKYDDDLTDDFAQRGAAYDSTSGSDVEFPPKNSGSRKQLAKTLDTQAEKLLPTIADTILKRRWRNFLRFLPSGRDEEAEQSLNWREGEMLQFLEGRLYTCEGYENVLARPLERCIAASYCPVARCGLQYYSLQHAGKTARMCRELEAKENEGEDVVHCDFCLTWIRESRWEIHCNSHLATLDKDCGLVRTTKFILRPALCPFCLGNTALACAQRLSYWNSTKKLMDHILHKHAKSMRSWPRPCPHPRCKATIRHMVNLELHLQKDHGLLGCRFQDGQPQPPRRKHVVSPEPVKPSKRLRQVDVTDDEKEGKIRTRTKDSETRARGGENRSTIHGDQGHSVTGDVLANLEAEELSTQAEESDSDLESLKSLGPKARSNDFLKSDSELKAEQEALWKKRGYPKIKWEKIPKRVKELKSWMETCIEAHSFPPFRERYANKLWKSTRKSRPLPLANSGGYYGPRGEALIAETLARELRDSLKAEKEDDILVSSGTKNFIRHVLVPATIQQFIQEDMGQNASEALETMEESVEMGHVLHPDLSEA